MTKRLTIALIALVALVLVAVMPVSATFYSTNSTINKGATVFYGEQGLNITHALNQANATAFSQYGTPSYLGDDVAINTTDAYVSWWASAAQIGSTSPTITVPVGTTPGNLYVLPSSFPYTGTYYLTDSTGNRVNGQTVGVFTISDPSLAVVVWDAGQALNVNGQSVIQGENLTVRVDNNLYPAIDPILRLNSSSPAVNIFRRADANANDTQKYLDVKVKTDSGNTLTALYSTPAVISTNTVNLKALGPNNGQWFLNAANGYNWSTDALDSTGQQAYPAGTYQVWAESYMNGMYDNYKTGGAAYTGKTVAETQTITIVSNTLKIEANKDSVVRSKQFSVTITGKPNQVYHVWVKGVSTMTGGYDDQPPMIAANQAGVVTDSVNGLVNGYSIPVIVSDLANASIVNGNYTYQNGGGQNLVQDTTGKIAGNSQEVSNGTRLYANVSMSNSGTRTVAFTTTNWTKAQKYTIRVEQYFGSGIGYKSDEVDVKVEKGAVTIVAAGDQSYYLGEEIKFSGTNTESQTTYLFISGPNLGTNGASFQGYDPRSAALDNFPSADQVGVSAAVQGDNTWSYKWGTASVALDAGTYTIYATSQPASAYSNSLSKVAYGTVSIIIKKPFISATASQSTVAQGDAVFITGTAQGQPTPGVMIWILGKNYANIVTQSVNSDGSFSYEIKKETTKPLYAGQYFIVAQHPMQNNRFDVYPSDAAGQNTVIGLNQAAVVWTRDQANTVNSAPSIDFKLSGMNSLQGSDAAEALIEAINSANVDDTYTKLQILIENPVINVDPVGDRHVGDKFTITATTNLAVDDEVLVEVYSSSFQPTQKSQSGEFSGATGTVKVTKGDSGLNKISFDVDASTFKPDEYLVKESAVLQDATGTALFNVLEASAPTATPTIVANVTSAAPTTIATQPPTTVATPTKTPTQPGFGALVALIGLGAVALLVVRKH
ncbi:MEMAR_RS02690 family S-layer glycoprotein [Methanoregula sp. UBA64]|uniref:MEMAR_RS02690 family S-layer glycoprotein n=1 Tax=Methanoregula sp. UBA64 TaxID=1915554 RepID=UPI0025F27E6D|nr:MEMAR_RS02690 family S-layer glycoprotein [Methanoregula sp. UBA64]